MGATVALVSDSVELLRLESSIEELGRRLVAYRDLELEDFTIGSEAMGAETIVAGFAA